MSNSFLTTRTHSKEDITHRSARRESARVPNPQNPYALSSSLSSHSLLDFDRGVTGNPLKKPSYSKLPPLRENSQDQISGISKPNVTQNSKIASLTPGPQKNSQEIAGAIKMQEQFSQLKRFSAICEKFFVDCYQHSVHETIEQTFITCFKAATVTYWHDIPSLHLLYSPRLQVTVSHSTGLVGYTFYTRERLLIEKAAQHSAYSDEFDVKICPGTTPVCIFPLWDYHDNVCAVVEITKTPKDPFFNEDNLQFIDFFSKQFKIHSKWLLADKYDEALTQELLHVMELEQFLLLFNKKIHLFFNCRAAELWSYNTKTIKMKRYTTEVTEIDPNRAGVVGDAIAKECLINCQDTKMTSCYIDSLDGEKGESCLVVPIIDIVASTIWAVCLRGSITYPVFTVEEEEKLKWLAPFLTVALNNADKYSEACLGNSRESLEHQCLAGLQNLSNMVMDGKKGQDILNEAVAWIARLTNADRGYVFKYDQNVDKYVAIASIGSKETPEPMEKDRGIIGKTFNTKKVINLSEAYDDPDFSNLIDLTTKYKTKTLLSIPLLNDRLDVIGVCQLLNRKDGQPFSFTDLSFAKLFSLVFGLMLDNQIMFNISNGATTQLASFISVSTALSSNASVKTILTEILTNARATTTSERASLFLLDDVSNVLISYIVDGGELPKTIPLSHGIAASALKQKRSIIVLDAYHDPMFNKLIDFHTGFETKSLLAVPVVTADGKAIGVAEMVNKKDGAYTQEDLKLLESFATFAALLLEKRKLIDITEKGFAQIEMVKWVGEFERNTYETPVKLRLPDEKQKLIRSLDFFAIDWNGIGLFKVAFFIFKDFDLLQTFQISNDLFFRFLFKLRDSYNEPPYHNWIHAIDVLQYISYQVRITNSQQILTKFELLAVCVAALCHDAGHQGFNNQFNVNAQTPLGILFKDQSVMETFHCTVAIRILSQPDTNLFHSLNNEQLITIWKWIIHLILATDMAKHFKLIKQGNDALDAGVINLKEEQYRLMVMELIMKVSDISNVSRPFKLADIWCDVLSEEFWRQGDREKELGLEYSGPLMNREGQNKAKGQVGFYNFICLPLYTLIARIFPELQVNLDSVKNNLSVWTKLVEEQEASGKKQ